MMKFKYVVLACSTLAIINFNAKSAEEYIELGPADVKAENSAKARCSVENSASAIRAAKHI